MKKLSGMQKIMLNRAVTAITRVNYRKEQGMHVKIDDDIEFCPFELMTKEEMLKTLRQQQDLIDKVTQDYNDLLELLEQSAD